MTFLSQSTAKIYVSFHTQGLCFWLNCARSPVLDSLLAASLTFATTSWEVALSCATTRLVSEKANRTTPRTTRTLLVFMILPFLRHRFSSFARLQILCPTTVQRQRRFALAPLGRRPLHFARHLCGCSG